MIINYIISFQVNYLKFNYYINLKYYEFWKKRYFKSEISFFSYEKKAALFSIQRIHNGINSTLLARIARLRLRDTYLVSSARDYHVVQACAVCPVARKQYISCATRNTDNSQTHPTRWLACVKLNMSISMYLTHNRHSL